MAWAKAAYTGRRRYLVHGCIAAPLEAVLNVASDFIPGLFPLYVAANWFLDFTDPIDPHTEEH